MNNLNITIGQYVKGNSYLYRLDPRFKILSTIILMIAIFLIPAKSILNLYILLGVLGFFILLMIFGRLNLLAVLKGLQPVLFIGLVTFVLQIVYNQTGTQMASFTLEFSWVTIVAAVSVFLFWFFTSKYVPYKMLYMVAMACGVCMCFIFINTSYAFGSTDFLVFTDGLIKGSFFFLRLVLIVILSTILTMTTSTTDINLGLEWVLHPLTFIKIPVGEFSMMLSLTLRFIPTLLIETDKIMKAQASRGIDFNEGTLMNKVKQIVTLLIPMFVVSINRAYDLANAMEARGYIIGAKRTSIDELRFRVLDYLGFLLVLALFAGSIVIKVML